MKALQLGALVLALLFPTLSGCDQPIRGGEAVQTESYVLVDLSETWFNAESAQRNRKLLNAVGRGTALVATKVKPPYLVQYRVIGDNALYRPPICSAVFTPGFRRNKDDDERISRTSKLMSYLARTCVDVVMASPPEKTTQLSAAIASVANEERPSKGSTRFIIILSDFLEETVSAAPIEDGSLRDTRILLLYRPLAEDQRSPAETTARVAEWRARLEAKGATVRVSPDTSIRASQIVSFLTQ